MALTEIEYGSLASSEVMNNNFEYLDNEITEVSENLVNTNAAMNSNVATINSSISSLSESVNQSIENVNQSIETLNTEINDIQSVLNTSGSYVTLYINGSSWYKEYFSNPEKTTRVWLEQGGAISTSNDYNITVTFLKSFSDTNYCIFKNMGRSGTGGVAERWMGFWDLTKSSAVTGTLNGFTQRWYACGV